MHVNFFCVKQVYSSERVTEYKMNKHVKSVLEELVQLYDPMQD